MTEQIYLFHMFPDYEPSEEVFAALSQAAIVAADIDPEAGRVEVAVHSQYYIPQKLLDRTAKDIAMLYGLRSLSLTATSPPKAVALALQQHAEAKAQRKITCHDRQTVAKRTPKGSFCHSFTSPKNRSGGLFRPPDQA